MIANVDEQTRPADDSRPAWPHAKLQPDALCSVTAGGESPREQWERMFMECFPMIQQVIATVARKQCLSADEAEEFAAIAQMRIMKNDYAVLRKFQGRCALQTFLHVVIKRFFMDHRISVWGKWRPSRASRRLGTSGIKLERLVSQCGFTFDQACEVLEADQSGLAASRVSRDTSRPEGRRPLPMTNCSSVIGAFAGGLGWLVGVVDDGLDACDWRACLRHQRGSRQRQLSGFQPESC